MLVAPAALNVLPCRIGKKSVRNHCFSIENFYNSDQPNFSEIGRRTPSLTIHLHPARASFISTSNFCLRVREFGALSGRGYAILTTAGVWGSDFRDEGTRFYHTFLLRVNVFDARLGL